MTKHKIKLQFNEPSEDHYIEGYVHCLGPVTDKLQAESLEFKAELGNDVSLFSGKVADIYLTVDIAMKPGGKEKYEEYCKRLNDLFLASEPPRGKKYDPEPHLRCYPEDDKITIKFLMVLPHSMSPAKDFEFPLGLREGLKDLD